jgi:hypothetical protein
MSQRRNLTVTIKKNHYGKNVLIDKGNNNENQTKKINKETIKENETE